MQLSYNQSLRNANKKKKGVMEMFKNLDAEQARAGMSNTNVAEKLGISRVSYENKKKTGKFTTLEIKCLVVNAWMPLPKPWKGE